MCKTGEAGWHIEDPSLSLLTIAGEEKSQGKKETKLRGWAIHAMI